MLLRAWMHRTSKEILNIVPCLLLLLLASEVLAQVWYDFCANTNKKNFGGTVQYNATSGGETIMADTYDNLRLCNTSKPRTAAGVLAVSGTQPTECNIEVMACKNIDFALQEVPT
jgi:hypothetical protein